jgi:hypothetical protein
MAHFIERLLDRSVQFQTHVMHFHGVTRKILNASLIDVVAVTLTTFSENAASAPKKYQKKRSEERNDRSDHADGRRSELFATKSAPGEDPFDEVRSR